MLLNKNRTKSKLVKLARHSVLLDLGNAARNATEFKDKLVQIMIPETLKDAFRLTTFEKLLSVRKVRQSCLAVIFNIIETDFLSDDPLNADYAAYLKSFILVLLDFFLLLLKIEQVFTTADKETLLMVDEVPFFNVIRAIEGFFGSFSSIVEKDEFGVHFSFDSLRTMIRQVEEDTRELVSDSEVNTSLSTVLEAVITLATNQKDGHTRETVEDAKKFMLSVDKLIGEDLFKRQNIFDSKNSYFTKLRGDLVLAENDEETSIVSESLSKSLQTVVAVYSSILDKTEISTELPIGWYNLAIEAKEELTDIASNKEKMQEMIDDRKNANKEKVELEVKIKELTKKIEFTNGLLGKAKMAEEKLGSVEADVEQLRKKNKKSEETIESLLKKLEEKKNKPEASSASSPFNVLLNKTGTKRKAGFNQSSDKLQATAGSLMDNLPLFDTIYELQV